MLLGARAATSGVTASQATTAASSAPTAAPVARAARKAARAAPIESPPPGATRPPDAHAPILLRRARDNLLLRRGGRGGARKLYSSPGTFRNGPSLEGRLDLVFFEGEGGIRDRLRPRGARAVEAGRDHRLRGHRGA